MSDEAVRMLFLIFAVGVALAMFAGSLAIMEFGRRLGARRLSAEGSAAMAGLSAVESAVFALMGLLLAFTLSGALQRYDERRALIIHEANAVSAAYDRLEMLEESSKTELRAKLRTYVSGRIELYRLPIGFSAVENASVYDATQLANISKVRTELWDGAVAACSRAPTTSPCNLILPALNEAYDAARERAGANERHPPRIIYIMLFGLGLGGSLLAGFGMGAAEKRSIVHMVTFAAAMSLALYIITDIEFPRQGLITVDAFDKFLEQALNSMK